ncbi:hypothetical protein HN51_067977 [Arachis hypogaea]|nr:probable endo-1,3(4)-beta-glucanase ARB_01444 [Arachis ipaensis]XP_025650191.1 probable endo-1,3(4)-beta-glucanase ARB_01444 [Arachis hypogaea]QHO09482.1 uncharacterized protein DS421_14g481640 [Arachis hypogaea]
MDSTKDEPFLFPTTMYERDCFHPSKFFSANLLSSPLPTNSFFQNFLLCNGDNPEYIHPYLIKPSASSLSLCYPSLSVHSNCIYQDFNPDLTVSSSTSSESHHVISSFTGLSVTLDFPSSSLSFFLVRGCPYVTFSVSHQTPLFSITTVHKFSSFTSNSSLTKYALKLDNGQAWLLYASLPIKVSNSYETMISFSKKFTSRDHGVPLVGRIALLPNSSSELEDVLDRYSTCYPVSGDALFTKPYCVEYKWEKRGFGNGDLLMLAHPLHLQLLSKDEGNVTVLQDFKYRSIDGDLVGVVGDSWLLKADHVPMNWYSTRGVKEESFDEIKSALSKDVAALCSSEITTISAYYYGKFIARAARLALIAEEIGFLEVIPSVKKFLHETIQPWLDGTFDDNGFLYDANWGGIVTKERSYQDFDYHKYGCHHYHLGYFLYGIAVLAKIDPSWGMKYKPHAYSIMADFMNLGGEHDLNSKNYTRLRCFDLYTLHSWGGETFPDQGREQDSTSEAVNAYYSAALMGVVYGDNNLSAIGSTLASLEIHAAKMWWHVKEGDNMYEEDFTTENKLVGYHSVNMRNRKMRYCYTSKESKIALHVLPLLPISECLFSNVDFVKELVEWTESGYGDGPADGDGDGWKGFVYALEGIYDNQIALKKIRSLKCFDCGNSLSNLLWWIHSRDDEEKFNCGHGSHEN